MIKLENLLTYGNNIYQISEQINSLTRKNEKGKIKASTGIKTIFTGFLCQNESINEMMETVHIVKSYENIYKPNEIIPNTHGLRDCIIDTPYEQIKQMNINMIKKTKDNKFFRNNQIDGLSVVAFDGVDEFETNKEIEGLAERNHRDGRVSKYYKAMGVMYLGEYRQLMLRLEELKSKESKEITEKIKEENKNKKISEKRLKEKIKAEGEITVLKRLLPETKKTIGRDIDVVVIDALYANGPTLNSIKENGLDAVVRFKEERREIYKDAMGIFEKRKADIKYEIVKEIKIIETKYSKESHKKNKIQKKVRTYTREITDKKIGEKQYISKEIKTERKVQKEIEIHEKVIKRIEAWSDEFEMTNYNHGKVRFVRYEEDTEKEEHKTILVVTTLLNQKLETILKIMHSRWLIENNGFRVLKDRYHLDHCYIGELNAIRVINEIIMLVYNLVNLYVNLRTKEFKERGCTMKILKKIFEKQITENRTIYLQFCNIQASL